MQWKKFKQERPVRVETVRKYQDKNKKERYQGTKYLRQSELHDYKKFVLLNWCFFDAHSPRVLLFSAAKGVSREVCPDRHRSFPKTGGHSLHLPRSTGTTALSSRVLLELQRG